MEYILELLTPETMKLSGSTKNMLIKRWRKCTILESVEVVLVHCNLVKMIITAHRKFHLLLFQTNNLES